MSDTLLNIPITPNLWVDLYSESNIPVGKQVSVYNVGDSDLYISISANQPLVNSTSYIVLKPRGLPFTNQIGESGLWAFSGNCKGLVNVSVYESIQPLPQTTAFGEASTAEPTPVIQIIASYGLTDELMPIVSNGGTTGAKDSLFSAESGTNPLGIGSLNSLKQLAYKAGQGSLCRITSLFSIGVPNSLQAAGLISSEDAFAIGYLNEDFGIIYSKGGIVEYQELTVDDAANNNQTATITIDGTPYLVPLTSGTEEHNAYEIAISLTDQVTNYLITANEAVVSIMAVLPNATGLFDFSSSGNALATFERIAIGTPPNISLIKQADFNRNTVPWLIPQNGNVYSISIQYLGFGGIEFGVEEPKTRRQIPIHMIEYANSNVTPSVGNPTFRIGWLARNLGNTSNLKVSGSSCAGFIEGKNLSDKPPRGFENKIINVGTTLRNIITVRNRFHFGDRINRAEAFLSLLSIGTDSAKGMEFILISNAKFEDDVNFKYKDKQSSILEYAYDSVAITPDSGSILIPFFELLGGESISLLEHGISILPDDQLTLAVRDVQLNNTDANAGLAICEEL